MQGRYDVVVTIWLREEYTPIWNIYLGHIEMTRGENELDWRPAVSNCTSQLQSIHRTWHVDVGKYNADVFSRFQYGNGFICVGCFYSPIARGFDQMDRMKPTKKFILNDKNVGL